jgi:curved DNA-binding protein CbpA
MNPFELLEIGSDASPDEIKAAYHRLAKQWHPDRFTGPEKAVAEEKFRSLAEAFSILKDPVKRQSYQPNPVRSGAPSAAAPTKESSTKSYQDRTADDWFKQAKEVFETGATDQALGLTQYAIRMDGNRAEYHVFLADLQEQSGDTRNAIRSLEMAQKLDPKKVEVLFRLADHYSGQGLQVRAQRLIQSAQELAPDHKRFRQAKRAAERDQKAQAADQPSGLAGQLRDLPNQFKALLGRFKGKG